MSDLEKFMERAMDEWKLPQDTWFLMRSHGSVISDELMRDVTFEIGTKVQTTTAAFRLKEVPADEPWLTHAALDHVKVYKLTCH